jgi:hypothetical protein
MADSAGPAKGSCFTWGAYTLYLENPHLLGISLQAQTIFFSVLKLLTNPDHIPAIINCSHGKDRTGIIVALILSLIGKSKEFISWDYALSQVVH